MLKANLTAVDALTLLKLSAQFPVLRIAADRLRLPPSTGLLQSFHPWMRHPASGFQTSPPARRHFH